MHTVKRLSVCGVYTMCVSGPSPDELRQQQHMGNGSYAHTLTPGNTATPRADGRIHTPVCFQSRWLCPHRAVIGLHLDTPPLTRLHIAGEHNTDLWGRTVIGHLCHVEGQWVQTAPQTLRKSHTALDCHTLAGPGHHGSSGRDSRRLGQRKRGG